MRTGWSRSTATSLELPTAGDVNGDSRADVIVGAPFLEDGEVGEGVALLYLGVPSTMVADCSPAGGLSAAAAWSNEGNQVALSASVLCEK